MVMSMQEEINFTFQKDVKVSFVAHNVSLIFHITVKNNNTKNKLCIYKLRQFRP